MFELTPEQRRELAQPEPLAIDPETQKPFVLVPKPVFDRWKVLLDDDDARLMDPLLADIDPEDWENA